MSILTDDMDMEDAMQTTNISAYEHLHQFEGRSSFSTWLIRIMMNESHARKKKNMKKKAAAQPDSPVINTTPGNILANKELSAVLENAVGQLPDKYRLVFV